MTLAVPERVATPWTGAPWTGAEDKRLIAARALGMTFADSGRQFLPGRNGGAAAARHQVITREDYAASSERADALNAKQSSDALLRALLRYGLRHDRDLGMGAERFYARCAEMGVAA